MALSVNSPSLTLSSLTWKGGDHRGVPKVNCDAVRCLVRGRCAVVGAWAQALSDLILPGHEDEMQAQMGPNLRLLFGPHQHTVPGGSHTV